MKNFLKNIYSKLNKGLLYTILVGIIYIISIRYWFYLQHDSSVQFLFALIMKFGINLLIILLPLLMIITSQKFTKKEKENLGISYLCIIFGLIIFGIITKQIALVFISLILAKIYFLIICILFWTHRKNDYSKEAEKIETPQEEIKE